MCAEMAHLALMTPNEPRIKNNPVKKRIFPGKSHDLPGKKQSYMCEKLSAAADMPEDYGSLLVIFVKAFSIEVRSAG